VKTNHISPQLLAGAILLYILFCYPFTPAHAQEENNVWTFGDSIRFDFNDGGLPLISTASLKAIEGCAAVSSPDGNLLFYSDGNRVWDRFNNVMPNGTDLLGNLATSSSQGVAIVPFLNHPDKYYLFVLDAWENDISHNLYYSVIDMQLNNGKGDIIHGQKNIIVDTAVGEKMTIIEGSDCFLWLVVHDKDLPRYHAFRIDGEGLHRNPVVSEGGLKKQLKSYALGEMKASPDTKLIATGTSQEIPAIELCDFDNETGIVSNPRCLDSFYGASYLYGFEFSPDNSKLYVGNMKSGLSQYDLSLLPDIEAARSSRVMLNQHITKGMRKSPDGVIYVISNGKVARINKPNEAGQDCDFVPDIGAPNIGTFCAGFGANFLHPRKAAVNLGPDLFVCGRDPVSWNVPLRGVTYEWQDGSTGPGYTATRSGRYWVKVRKDGCTSSDTVALMMTDCDNCLMVPGAFSPNHDGTNDVLLARTVCGIKEFSMKVYNRWGQLVFSAHNIASGWDGTSKGQQADCGTYMYEAVLINDNGKVFKQKGDVVLIR
jgi:gliding motility-associated-like protein